MCYRDPKLNQCHASFYCAPLPQGVTKAKYLSMLRKNIPKQLPDSYKISIDLTEKKRALEQSQLLTKNHSSDLCQSNLCLKRVSLNSLRVTEKNGADALTTNISWTPLYHLNKSFLLKGQIGGHFLSTEDDDSIFVFEMGAGATYKLGQFGVSAIVGNQYWNGQNIKSYLFTRGELTYYLHKGFLKFIDEFSLSFQKPLSSKYTEYRAGFGLQF